MSKIATKEDLDQFRCLDPHCTHEHDDIIWLWPACHEAPVAGD
jgi:hypothetical protein